MRYSLLIFSLLCSFWGLNAQKDSTVIDVYAEGIGAGKMRLVGTFADQNYLADSAMVDDKGHFTVRRQKPLPPGFYTFLLPGTKNFSILIDTAQHITLQCKSPDFVNTMRIEGSGETQLFYQTLQFQAKQEPELNQVLDAMRKSAPNTPAYAQAKQRQTQMLAERKTYLDNIYKQNPEAFFTKFKIAGQNPDITDFKKSNGDIDTIRNLIYYRQHFWDGVDFNDNRLLYTPVIVNKLKRYIKELTPQQPDSIIKIADALITRVLPNKAYFKFFANWIGLQYENGKTTVMDGEAVYVYIIKKYMTKEFAYWSNEKEIEGLQKHVWEMEASLLGKKGPDVEAADMNGKMHSIYAINSPLVVVFMFSPDCEHCIEEAPKVQRIYEKWKDKGVEFFGIAVNTTDPEWRKFLGQQKFTFTNVYDPSNRAIYAKYFVDITPELYVLNKDRIIVAKNLKSEQLETIFERELKKLK